MEEPVAGAVRAARAVQAERSRLATASAARCGWRDSGTAGAAGGNDTSLLASGGAPGNTGDPCTPEGCPETVATGQIGPRAIAVDAGNLYWSNVGPETVVRMPFGGTPAVIASNASDAFAIDATSVYWITYWGDAVMKAPLTGGPAVKLADRSSAVIVSYGLAVDATSVYWGEYRSCLGVLMKGGQRGWKPDRDRVPRTRNSLGPIAIDATNLTYFLQLHGPVCSRSR